MVPTPRLGKQLIVETPNEVGMLAKVCSTFASEGINILCLSATEHENKGHFCIITDNNPTGAKMLKSKGFNTVEEKDVVLVEIGSQPGTLAPVAKALGDANINVQNCFLTTGNANGKILAVFTTENNPKAVEVIQKCDTSSCS